MPTLPVLKARTALLLAAALVAVALPACTAFDRFKFEPPTGEVSIEGTPEATAYAPNPPVPKKYDKEFNDCPVGATVYWGQVKNTGDVVVEEVKIVVDLFGAAGEFLGRFVDGVYNGEVTDDQGKNPTPGTSLEIEQTGVFAVCCSSVPFGRAARATFRTEFLVLDDEEL